MSALPPRISLVTLGVADVEAAAAFYERVGWVRSSSSAPGVVAFFDLGGTVLALFGHADFAADAGLASAAPPGEYRGQALAVNFSSEAEVDAALSAAVAAGASVVKAPVRAEWGGYSGYFADPDGNLWEVAWNPGWGLDSAGRVVLSP